LAQHIPIIGGIFEQRDIHEDDRLVGLAEYAAVVGEKQYGDGFSIMLNEAFFDGATMFLTYLIEVEEVDGNDDPRLDPWYFDSDIALRVAGVEDVNATLSIAYHDIVDEGVHIMIIELIPDVDITDESIVEVEVTMMNTGVGESWIFNVPVEVVGENLANEAYIISQDGFDIRLENVVLSPAGLSFDYTYTTPYPELPDDIFEGLEVELVWEAMDDLENVMDPIGIWTQSREGGHVSFESPPQEAMQIIITPIAWIDDGEEVIELEPIVIDLP